MSDNPFQPPESDLDGRAEQRVTGVLSGSRSDLKKVATYQRAIMLCILMNIGAVLSQFVLPQELKIITVLCVIVFGIASTVFVFLLAAKVYGVALGVIMGLFAMFPCIGLLVLLAVNAKATKVLTDNGIRVGFLGADLSKI